MKSKAIFFFAILAGFILYVSDRAGAVDVPFGPQNIISSNADMAYSVNSADIDGDGDLDVVSASINDDKVAWYQNWGGNPITWTVYNIDTAASRAQSVYAADVDGDGNMDVLATFQGSDAIVWYENDGDNPPQWTAHIIGQSTTLLDYPVSIVAADIDSDGDLDVVVAAYGANHGNSRVSWWENNGAFIPSFTEHDITTSAVNPVTVVAADMDKDGDLDVLVASFSDDTIAWYENNGSRPPVWTENEIANWVDGAYSVIAADIDDDSFLDVVSASYDDHKIRYFLNDRAKHPTFTEGMLKNAAGGPFSVYAADMDMDGDLDITAADNSGGKVAWYENEMDFASGLDWYEREISSSASGAAFVQVADLDHDGDPDVLSASANDDKVAWYMNETLHRNAYFLLNGQSAISSTLNNPQSVCAADINGDGKMDVLSASRDDDTIAWHENDGTQPPSWTTRTITTSADGAYSVYAADVDGDGKLDVLSDGFNDGNTAWYKNWGGNPVTWTAYTINAFIKPGSMSVFAADIDGDGDMDVVSGSAQSIYWFEHGGTWPPTWTERQIYTYGGSARYTVYVGDVDGDGDMDIISSANQLPEIAWWENNGANPPTFTQHVVSTTAVSPYPVFAADMDGDGDLDILSGNLNTIVWYENDGASPPSWTEHAIATVTAGGAQSAYAADMDNDGDLDVLAAEYSGWLWWYENDGDSLTWAGRNLVDSGFSVSVVAADIDGDGYMDALSSDGMSDKIAWHKNRGGQFGLNAYDAAAGYTYLNESGIYSLLRIRAYHLGRAGEGDIELTAFELLFEDYQNLPAHSLTSAEANNLIANLYIYADADDDREFNIVNDTLVAAVPTLLLISGVQTVSFDDNDPLVRYTFSAPRDYFVVVEIAPNAWSQSPDRFRVTSQTDYAGSADDAAHDIPLKLAYKSNVNATSLMINASPTDIGLTSTNVAENSANGTVVGTLSTTDPDNSAPYLYTIQTGGVPFSINTDTLVVNGSLNYEVKNSYMLWIKTTDAYGAWYHEAFTITVTDVDELPDAVNDSATVSEGGIAIVVAPGPGVLANDTDPDGDTLAVSVTNTVLPAHGALILNYNGTISYTHDGLETTSDSFVYLACENVIPTYCDSATVTITVIPVNDPPDAEDDAITVNEGGTATTLTPSGTNLLTNDTDPENNTLTVNITPVTAPTRGLLTLNANGTFSYTHNGSETTSDSFIYRACDNGIPSLCDNATVTISVNPVNDPPNAINDTITVNEGGTATTLTPSGTNLLANDTDIENNTLTVNTAPVTPPAHGAVTLNASGTFSYTHDGSETASDSFIYRACDNGTPSQCDDATVAVTVTPVNDPPVAGDDSITVNEGGTATALTGGATSLLANDTDADSNNLTVTTPMVMPSYGTVTLNANGTFSYTHNGSETAADSFIYEVCDGGTPNHCDTATVAVTITPVNDPPAAADDSANVDEGGTAAILNSGQASLLANDTDPESTLTVDTVPAISPVNGTLTLSADGTFSYIHNGSETTSDSFTYEACDGGTPNLCDTAVVTITVNPVNDPPQAMNDSLTVNEGGTAVSLTGGGTSLLANDTDSDNNTLKVSTNPAGIPSHGFVTLNADGTFTYTHDGSETTSDSFGYEVCDDSAFPICDTAVVAVTITTVNDPPIFADPTPSGAITVKEGEPITFTVAGTDPESNPLTYSVTGLPEGATFDAVTGVFTWTPTVDDIGTKSLTLAMSDGTNVVNWPVTIEVTAAEEENGGGGGCGCAVGPNQPGDPLGLIGFIVLGMGLAVRKRRWLGC